jgi:hypothetical protein
MKTVLQTLFKKTTRFKNKTPRHALRVSLLPKNIALMIPYGRHSQTPFFCLCFYSSQSPNIATIFIQPSYASQFCDKRFFSFKILPCSLLCHTRGQMYQIETKNFSKK